MNSPSILNRAPQLEIDFCGNGDGGITSQNDPLRLGHRSFGSKLMFKTANFLINGEVPINGP